MTHLSKWSSRLILFAAILAALLVGHLAWTAQHRVVIGDGYYLFTDPSGATVIEKSRQMRGFIDVPIGVTPGPLQLSDGAVSLELHLPGFYPKKIEFGKLGFENRRYPPSGDLELPPRVPVLIPLLYFALRQPFLVGALLWPALFYWFLVRPLRRQEDEQRLRQELFLRGEVQEGTEIERYLVEAKLGEGGMATVFRVRPHDGGPPLALKLLKPQMAREVDLRRFLAETTLLRQLRHPHVVALYDHGEHRGRPFLVMECLQGKTLDHYTGEQSDWPEKARFFYEIGQALVYLHGQGLVHRDLKPSNVFITEDGKAVLMDLGIARQTRDSPLRGKAQYPMPSVAGEVMGTPGHMSPEQLVGGDVSWRSDVYSLALLILEVVTGEPPFGRGHPVEVLARQSAHPSPSIPALPDAGLEEVLRDWVRVEPEHRAKVPEDVLSRLQPIWERATRKASAEG